jgi:dUTPase
MVPTSIIDEDYIGSIHLIAHNVGDECVTLERGVRLVQGMLMKLLPNNKYTLLKYMQQGFISDILDDNNITAFRSGGIGSTGK